MATITGTILTPTGSSFTGTVNFYPDASVKLLTAGQVTGLKIAATVTDGALSQALVQGAYLVEIVDGATNRFRIVVPDSEASISIGSLITAGAANLPTLSYGVVSFNSRTGDVAPAAGDYSDEDITASATATNYTPTGATVGGHLAGIDEALAGVGGSVAWGGITGTLSDQADLQAALDGKSATTHDHDGDYDAAGSAIAAVASHASGSGVHSIAGVTGLQTALDAKAGYSAVASLPGSPTAGVVYRLTAADATAKAPPGYYVHDSGGWFCLGYSAVFDLGNLTGSVSLSLIAGAAYEAATTGNITTYDVALSRTGLVRILRSNATGYTVAQPESSGLTSKLLSSTAWDDAAEDGVLDILEDDGTYLIASTSALA